MDNNAIRQDRPLKFVFMCVKFIFYIANTTLVILEPPEYCSVRPIKQLFPVSTHQPGVVEHKQPFTNGRHFFL